MSEKTAIMITIRQLVRNGDMIQEKVRRVASEDDDKARDANDPSGNVTLDLARRVIPHASAVNLVTSSSPERSKDFVPLGYVLSKEV
jgi:hypothetical protein